MTMSRKKRLALTSSLAVLALLAGGCANQTTAYRTQRLGDSPMVITTDAFQRHTIMMPDADPRRRGMWQTCSEASPDVFSALSASAAADLGLDSRGSGTQARARAAMAIAQSAATAERTQTINLLRESMFRTCERYLSGAINRSTLVVQAGRDWRAMIAILAIEQLTQTGRPSSTIIAGGGTTAEVISTEEARRELDAAKRRVTQAEARQSEAEAMECPASTPAPQAGQPTPVTPAPAQTPVPAPAQGASDDETPPVDDPAGAGDDDTPAAGEGGTENAPTPAPADTEADQTCATKQEAIDKAKADVARAQAEVAEWQAKVNSAERTGASTVAGTSSGGGGGGSLTPGALIHIAPVVERIVNQAFGTDETQLFCLQVLQDEVAQELKTRCLAYLMDKVQAERGALFRSAAARAAGYEFSLTIRTARDALASFLQGLPAGDYETERLAIAAQLPNRRLCTNRTLQQCISDITQHGEIDMDASRILGIVSQREQARSRQ